MAEGEDWNDMDPSESLMGTAHLGRANTAVHTFTGKLWWCYHRLYVNQFFKDRRVRKALDVVLYWVFHDLIIIKWPYFETNNNVHHLQISHEGRAII